MGIGGALAEARTEAGLTVTEVSERTRIRETIIRDIEHDDYSACGGDYYARGHIRAIARVVGTDPVPLIEEYDTIHNPPELPPAEPPPPPPAGPGWRARWSHWLTGDDPGGGVTKINGRDPGASAAFPADADTDPSLYDAAAEGLSASSKSSASSPSGAATMESVARWAASARTRVSSPDTGATGPVTSAGGPADATIAIPPAARRSVDDTAFGDTAFGDRARDDQGLGGLGFGGRARGGTAFGDQAHGDAVYDDMVLDDAVFDDTGYERSAPGGSSYDQRSVEDVPGSYRRNGSGVPGGISAADAFRPAMPLQRPRGLSGRGLAIVLVVLAGLGLLVYFLVAGGPSKPAAAHSKAGSGHAAGQAGAAGHGSPARSGSTASASPAGHSPAAAVVLHPLRAAAFGPGGIAHGDNPGEAGLAIDGSPGTSWHSDWYVSANFGNLQSGTGLLLTMSQPVKISAARLLLAPQAGGNVQLRAGNSPALSALPVVARSANTGGVVTLRVAAPVSARYVLIWFTSLPPDGAGTYQAKVFNIHLSGTS